MVDVGGVRIAVGVSTEQLMQGFKQAETRLEKFVERMKNIRLEGVIKGDPFKATNRYMEDSRKALNSVFDAWKKDIHSVDEYLDKWAVRAKTNTEKVIERFEKLEKQMNIIKKSGELLHGKEGAISKIDFQGEAGPDTKGVNTIKEYIAELKGFSEEADAVLDIISQSLETGVIHQEHQLKDAFKIFTDIVRQGGPRVIAAFTKFKNTLSKAFKEQTKLELQHYEGTARTRAVVKREEEIKKLKKSNIDALASIKEKTDVEKNEQKILENNNRLRELGAKISLKALKAEINIDYKTEQRNKQKEKELELEKQILYQIQKRAKEEGVSLTKTGQVVAAAPRTIATPQEYRNEAVRERAKLIKDIRLENKKNLKAIEAGFDIDKNRERIIANLNRLKKAGVKLDESEVKLLERMNKESYAQRLKDAGDITKAYEKREKATQRMRIALKKLNTEIKAGIGISTQRADKMKILNQGLKDGAELTQLETRELRKYNKEQERVKATGGMFSKEWLINRAGWFIQLRLFWGLYRKTGQAVESLIKFEDQLARALRTASSNMKTSTQLTIAYGKALQGAVQLHGVDWEAPAEALYQLGSAGLSAEESLAGLNSTLSLIVGTEGDVRETTKAVAGVYNNFKDTLTEFNTPQEKLLYINNLMAAAWKKHQVEIGELTDGYARASAVAKVVGISLNDLTALLAVANDHMIKGGVAGRALASVWSRLSRDVDKFKDVFQLKFDTSKPLNFIKIMDELGKRFKSGALSVDQLGDMFERLGLRGSPVFATLLKNWDDVKKAQKDFLDVTGEAADLEQKRLESLDKQWALFVGRLKAYLANAKGLLDVAKDILKWVGGGMDYLLAGTVKNLDMQIKATRELIKQRKENIKNLEEQKRILGSLPSYIKLDVLKKDLEDLEHGFKRLVEMRAQLTGEGGKPVTSAHEKFRLSTIAKEKQSVQDLGKAYKYLAQEEFYRIRQAETDIQKLMKARREENKQAIVVDNKLAEAKKLNQKVAHQAWVRVRDEQKLLNKLTQERIEIENKVNAATRKELQGQRSLYKEQEQIQIKIIDAQMKKITEGGRVTRDEQKTLNNLYKERLVHSNNIAAIDEVLNTLAGKTTQIASDNLELAKEQNKEDDKNRRTTTDRMALQTELNDLIDEYNKKIDKKEYEIKLAKINHETNLDILNLQKDSLNLSKELLEKEIEKTEGEKDTIERTKQLYALNNKLRDTKLDILVIDEKINRANSITYDWIQRMKDRLKEWHEVATDALVTFTEGFGTGLGDVFADFTGGFQEQQQEVVDLEDELKNLQKDLDEAIDDADIERVKEIKDRMAELNREIDDLKDPIENIKSEFNDFFKSLIDGIRKAISEWLAMQLVMGVIGSISGTHPAMAGGAPTKWYGTGFEGQYSAGGILPNIKAFRSFSAGGMTNRPTLALLGDNRSKQELVIPTENIKSDNVSGYMRESERPIYIINAITDEEIAQSMTKTTGEKVIVNSVIKNRGVIRRNL